MIIILNRVKSHIDKPETNQEAYVNTKIVFQFSNVIFVTKTPEQIYDLIDYAKFEEDKKV